jgi:hypothetical protein
VSGHPSRMPRRHARHHGVRGLPIIGIATLAVLVIAAAGCQATTTPQPTPTPDAAAATGTPSPAASPPHTSAEQQALAAYRGMWHAYVEATHVADPAHPDLPRYATGDALDILVDGLEVMASNGLASRGDVVLDPRVTDLVPPDDPTTAAIDDCVDTSGTELYRTSGEPYQDSPGGPRRAQATVENDGDGWKVTRFALYEVGSCDA